MLSVPELISHFIESLESHPNGQELIRVIEEILSSNSKIIDPLLISSLKELSNNNISLLTDFWILRASILKEEGQDHEAMVVFFEATQWQPANLTTWLRIIEFYSTQQEYIRVSFFLFEAQKYTNSGSLLQEDYNQLLQLLHDNLSLPLGIITSDLEIDQETSPSDEISSKDVANSISNSSVDVENECIVSSEASTLWEQALECFKEGFEEDNLIYLQAFIHYAHSTVRELLRLDENFKAGIERQVAKYGLFEYKNFFNKLNRLRNDVIHENYIVSKEEALNVHSKVSELLKEQFKVNE